MADERLPIKFFAKRDVDNMRVEAGGGGGAGRQPRPGAGGVGVHEDGDRRPRRARRAGQPRGIAGIAASSCFV